MTSSALIVNMPCVNCKVAPCRCLVDVVDDRGVAGGQLRRYEFPDGTVLRLDDRSALRAVAAGAVLLEDRP